MNKNTENENNKVQRQPTEYKAHRSDCPVTYHGDGHQAFCVHGIDMKPQLPADTVRCICTVIVNRFGWERRAWTEDCPVHADYLRQIDKEIVRRVDTGGSMDE